VRAPGLCRKAAVGEYTADTGPPGWPALSSRPPSRVPPPVSAERNLVAADARLRRRIPRGRAGGPAAGVARGLLVARLSPSPGSLLRPALSFARRSPHARYLPFLGFLALPARLRPADTHRASSPGPVGSALCSVLLVLFPASASLGDASFLAGRSSDSVLRAPLYRSSVMDRSGPLCRARRLVQPRKGLL